MDPKISQENPRLQSKSVCYGFWAMFTVLTVQVHHSSTLFLVNVTWVWHSDVLFIFQSILSVVFILICCTLSIVCLVLKQRNSRDYRPVSTEEPDLEQSIKVSRVRSKVKKVNGNVTRSAALSAGGGNGQIQIDSSSNRCQAYKPSCNDCDQGCSGGETICVFFLYCWLFLTFWYYHVETILELIIISPFHSEVCIIRVASKMFLRGWKEIKMGTGFFYCQMSYNATVRLLSKCTF